MSELGDIATQKIIHYIQTDINQFLKVEAFEKISKVDFSRKIFFEIFLQTFISFLKN